MVYVLINTKRKQIITLPGYAGKTTPNAIQVDKKSPSNYHKLKADYQNFTGLEQWEVDTTKKQQAIEAAETLINQQTDTAILTGFKHQGYSFILSTENQFNFKADYDVRDLLTYPYRVKHATGYLYLQSADEYQAFYLAGISYIRSQIEAGWNAKDALQNMTTKQLIEFIDNPA